MAAAPVYRFRMFTVKALLNGHEFDLRAMADLFPSGDPTVTKDDEGYWLSSVSLEHHEDDAAALDSAASALLERVNGATRLERPGVRPATLAHRYSVASPEGVKQPAVVLAEAIEIRARVEVVAVAEVKGAAPSEPPEPAPEPESQRALRLAGTNKDVASVLHWLAGDQSWYDLWKIYETLSGAVGGQDVMAKRWGMPKSKFKALRVSAHRAEVSGEAARHAPSKAPLDPNIKTMTPAEGREFVRELVARWLEDLDAEAPPQPAT